MRDSVKTVNIKETIEIEHKTKQEIETFKHMHTKKSLFVN